MARLRIPALAAILAVAVSVPAAGQTTLAPGGTFLDDDFRAAEPAIEALVAAGITNGCAAGTVLSGCNGDPGADGDVPGQDARRRHQ